MSLFIFIGVIILSAIIYYVFTPKPVKLTEEQKKDIIKLEQAAFSEVESANFNDLQQIELLVQKGKWEEAKQKLDNYKSLHTKIGNERELLNSLSLSICLQVADFNCLDSALISFKELDDKALYITSSHQAAQLAIQKNLNQEAKKYYVQLKEVVDALGGENYLKSLAERDKESGFSLAYSTIVEGAH